MKKLRYKQLTILVLFLSCKTYAAGFSINEFSPKLQSESLAGAAASFNDVSAMFLNPATLATIEHKQFYIGGSILSPNISVKNASAIHSVSIPGAPSSSITANVLGSTSQSNITNDALIPSAFFGWRFHPKMIAGLSFTSPFGLTTSYHSQSVLRFSALKSQLQTFNLNPVIAFEINPTWRLGVGAQFQYAQAIFSSFNGPYTGIPPIDAFISPNHSTELHGYGWGYGYNLGVLYSPCETFRLGAGYRSQIVQHLKGHGQQYVSPGPTVPAPSQFFLFNAQTNVNGSLNLPPVLTISAEKDFDKWTVKATAQVNFWHVFDQLSINMPNAFVTNSTIITKWKNAIFVSLGANYELNDKWILRFGSAFDQTPTQKAYRNTRIADANRVWLTGGLSYQLNKQLSLDGAFEHIFIADQQLNAIQASGTNAISSTPLEINTVNANYSGWVNILAFAVRYSFA